MSPDRANPLECLLVFDRLEVGPAQLEPTRLSVPYTLTCDGKSETTQIVYKYEEDVFQADDLNIQNMANVMGAQIALNYGLFCREIVFHGVYDQADRRFLLDMAENTAREIYVKKFLEPNPFLIGEAAQLKLSPQKLPRYLQAELTFPALAKKTAPIQWQAWPTEQGKHAILSSGGKDSLLTYGLLDEMNCETHPIYVNESGRHWFTALNAYRHFKDHIPNTARVWTDSDRLFAWMLRRMPFIRQDFARLRSDEYPIRLWTVAIFLFGAIPLMRKRNIGRLIIGDEYDTTTRVSFKGITHYNGLYDQSRYFDNALSRFFHKKGWNICQFSLLRPLSEFAIQKTLATRYPHLHRFQVSCHAAHKEGEQVHPCGQCEKCRRIISMLKAIDIDPAVCGYTQDQIKHSLESIFVKGLHQESAGVRHLLYLLSGKKLITLPPAAEKKLTPRTEIAQMRFDPERSPMEGIPQDLRIPLYTIFSQYTEGAVLRAGHEWKSIDLFQSPLLHRPYSFKQTDSSTTKDLQN